MTTTESMDILLRMRDELTGPLKQQQQALKGVREQTQKLTETTGKYTAAIGETSSAVGASLGVFAAIGAAILGGAGAFAYATAKLAEFAAAQSEVGEKLAASYLLFNKNTEAAERTRDMIDEMAARSHVPVMQLHGVAKELLEAGIKPQRELQETVQAISDLQKTGNEGAAKKLQGIFARGATARRQFGGAGMVGLNRQEITESLGVGAWEQVQASLAKNGGKALQTGYSSLMTTADAANKALAEVVTKGKIGEAAKNMVGGFGAVMEHAQEITRKFFDNLHKMKGFQNFMNALHHVIDVFEVLTQSKGGTGVLDKGFDLLAKGIHKAIIMVLKMTNYTIIFTTHVLKQVLAFKQWIKQGDHLNIIKAGLLGVGLLLAGILATITLLTVGFVILWAVVMAPVLLIVAAFVALGVAIYEVTKYFKKWKQEASDAVTDLIDGLINGIKNGVAKIQKAAGALGKGVISGIKTALDMHSPSKEMMKLGAFAASGFQMGMDQHGAFQLGNTVAMPASGAKGGGKMGDVSIEVNVQGSTNMQAHELKPLMTSAFADALELVQLEFGGG